MQQILVVDDDHRIRYLLSQFLKLHGSYQVIDADNTQKARVILNSESIDLIVLDVMMPNESGMDFLKCIRRGDMGVELGSIAIILLTAKDDVQDRLQGLSLEADDYLTKPFEPRELLLRIQSVLRRVGTKKNHTFVTIGEFVFGLITLELTDGQDTTSLTTTEAALLKYLVQQPLQAITRGELANHLGYQISERTIDVQIARLRRRLRDDDPPRYLKTVRHVGYMFCP